MRLRKSFSAASFSAARFSATRRSSRPSTRAPGTRPPQTVRIDGANMALHLAVDRDHDLVEMPLVAELRGAPTDLAGAGPAECLSPTPHGVVPDSWLTMIPRAASRSSTIHRLSGKRKYSQTACSRTSAGNLSPRSMDVALVNIAFKEPMFVDPSST